MSPSQPTERLQASNPAHLARAAWLLRTGHTVAFPTETVYGLGANALDPAAVEQIFVAKQRPHWDPLIVHIASRTQLPQIALVSPEADVLMQAFWPGPLTLLLPRTLAIPDAVTAGRPLVGVRQPNHPVALELLRQAGVPIAAPSANTFSHTSPTTAQHVLDDLDGRIDAILDGGPTIVGLESTVAEVTNQGVRIYRPGAIDVGLLEIIVDYVELYRPANQSPSDPPALPAPGFGLRHYAPQARLVLVNVTAKDGRPRELSLVAPIDQATTATSQTGVMLPEGWDRSAADHVFSWGPWHDGDMLARRLFAGLRTLDQAGATIILCPVPEMPGIGEAIRDRLQKAARPQET